MRRLRSRSLGAVGVLAVLLSACSLTARTSAAGGSGAPVHVALTDFAISLGAPIVAGRAVTLQVANESQSPHQLAVEAPGQTYQSDFLTAGQSDAVSLPALEAGTYRFWCTVAGHAAAGMDSRVTVGAAGAASPVQGAISPEQMDRLHEAGVLAFPAKTAGTGGRLLAPRMENGVKVFDLTAKAIQWEVTPGKLVEAFAYNGQVPGPEIRVRKGDRVRIVLHNELRESTALHFHGLTVPNAMDGVPFITQPPVKPGTSFTYEFPIVDGPGTSMYHSHHNATIQVGKGLLGALIIEAPTDPWPVEHTMVLGDGELGFTLNGKGFPATAPIVVKKGQRVLVRFMNEGQIIHPMHLHGFHFRVIARDGQPLASPYSLDTVSVAPGERWDVEFVANLAGIWAFHCHILSHAESEHGMHGMVTAVIVQ